MANILLLDDNKEICEFITEVLGEVGHEVLFFEDPTLAFLAGKNYSETIDMVIFDIQLQKYNGIEFTHLLRKIAPKQKFLCISGYISEHATELNGISISCLSKPFSREKLIESVSDVLSQVPTNS